MYLPAGEPRLHPLQGMPTRNTQEARERSRGGGKEEGRECLRESVRERNARQHTMRERHEGIDIIAGREKQIAPPHVPSRCRMSVASVSRGQPCEKYRRVCGGP